MVRGNFFRLVSVFLLVILTSFFAAAETGEQEAPIAQIKPYDSTIYPEDHVAAFFFDFLPATSETAAVLLGLSYKDEMIQAALDRRANSLANYDINGFESVIGVIFPLVIDMTIVMLVIISLKLGFKKISGQEAHFYKRGTFIVSAMALTFPLNEAFPLTLMLADENGVYVTLAGVVAMMLAFSGLGAANLAYSTVLNHLSVNLPDNGLSIDGSYRHQVEITDAISNVPYNKARALIESAMCLNSASSMGVYLSANERRESAAVSIFKNGASNKLTPRGDGAASLHEFSMESGVTKITSGWGVEHEDPAWVCDTKTIIAPQPPADFSELNKALIEIGARSLLEKRGELTEDVIYQSWAKVKSQLSAGTKADHLKVYTDSAKYFYDLLFFALENGDLNDDKSIEDYNYKVGLADKLAKELMSLDCYEKFEAYVNTKHTVAALNQGNIGVSSFDMSCSVVSNGRLAMMFDVNASSPRDFAIGSIELLSGHAVRLKDHYDALVSSFEPYVLVSSAYLSTLKEIRSDAILNSEGQNKEIYFKAIESARREGVMASPQNLLGITESAGRLIQALSKEISGSSSLGSANELIVNYDSQAGYLPKGMPSSGVSIPSVTLPAFMLRASSDVRHANVGKVIEDNFDSQISSSQGNTMASTYVKDTGYLYSDIGLDVNQKTQPELAEEMFMGLAHLSLEPFYFEDTYAENGLTMLERKFKMFAMCGLPTITAEQAASLGGKDPFGDVVGFCEKYSVQLAQTYKKNLGIALINDAATIFAMAVTATTMAVIVGKKQKDGRGERKNSPDKNSNSGISEDEKISDIKGAVFGNLGAAGNYIADTLTDKLLPLIKSAVLQNIGIILGMILLVVGLFYLSVWFAVIVLPLSMFLTFFGFIFVSVVMVSILGLLVAMSDEDIDFYTNVLRVTFARLLLYPLAVVVFVVLALIGLTAFEFAYDMLLVDMVARIGDASAIGAMFGMEILMSAIVVFAASAMFAVTGMWIIKHLANMPELIINKVSDVGAKLDDDPDTGIAEAITFKATKRAHKGLQGAAEIHKGHLDEHLEPQEGRKGAIEQLMSLPKDSLELGKFVLSDVGNSVNTFKDSVKDKFMNNDKAANNNDVTNPPDGEDDGLSNKFEGTGQSTPKVDDDNQAEKKNK